MDNARKEALARYKERKRLGLVGKKHRSALPVVELPVYCGDVRDIIDTIPRTAYLISDPPYNQGYHYDNYADNLPALEYEELLRRVFQRRPCVIIHYPEETINILSRVVGVCSDVMAWVYNANQAKQHRSVSWWGCKPDWTKTPQDYKNPTDLRVAKLIADGKQARGYDWVEINHVKNVAGVGHPCPIPPALAERLILATTKPGDTVFDPFAGVGTIVSAALRLGRHGHGAELSPTYAALANADALSLCTAHKKEILDTDPEELRYEIMSKPIKRAKQDPAKAAIALLDKLSKRMQYALSDPKEFARLRKALKKTAPKLRRATRRNP